MNCLLMPLIFFSFIFAFLSLLFFLPPTECVLELLDEGPSSSYSAGRSKFFVPPSEDSPAIKWRRNQVDMPQRRRSQSFSDLRDYRRDGIQLDDLEQASEVFLNTYNYMPMFNKVLGERLNVPGYHSAVKFRGPLWPGAGREIEIAGRNNGRNHFNEEDAAAQKDYELIESKYMGLTQMRPQSIREFVGLVPPRKPKRRNSFGSMRELVAPKESIGDKYKFYHATGANCNRAAEEILMKTLQRTPPKRHNRLARKINKLTHLHNVPLHRLPFGLG